MSQTDKNLNVADSSSSESEYESNDSEEVPNSLLMRPLTSYEKLLLEQKEKEENYRREPTNYGIKPSLYTNLSKKLLL